MFVAGTGSFAAEIVDWARAAGLEVAALIEMLDGGRVSEMQHGLPVVSLERPVGAGRAVLGLGGDRRVWWARMVAHGWAAAGVVHPTASLAADARLGLGTTIGPLAVVGAATTIEAQAIVSRGALIGHHARVGAYATLNPGVNIGGNTSIGSDVFIGMSATVVNGTTIGDRAVIGAGAVVLRDVDADTRVQGIPARVVAVAAR